MAACAAMSSARTALRPSGTPADKRGFVKRASGFVKRAPGFPMLWIGCIAAAGLMIVTGGFGTSGMPLGQRAGFWALLMAWSGIKWQLWFAATVRGHRDWFWSAALGAVVLSLPLPIEIRLCARAVGIEDAIAEPFGTWGRALAIGAVLFVTVLLILRATGHFQKRRRVAAPAEGLLARARVSAETLAAIEAEDHYCRVHRIDGSDALIHYRFGDALAEVAELDGAQVHRGSWVAADAVTGATRDGRRWLLLLSDGTKVAVSPRYVAEARRRGWLNLRV